jgi:transposase
LPAHLPREEVIHDLSPQEKSCGHCGSFLSQIGVEEREQLETVFVQFVVKKHKRLKYACKCCGETVAIAKSPSQAIEKGIAGPNLLAQVLVDKYGDHLPLYRQEQRFKRHGIHINRSTLWNWVYLSSLSLAPLVEAMTKDLLVVGHVFSDDTTMPTLREPIPENKGKKTKTNYMWTYNGLSKKDKKPIIIYDFTEGRDGKYPEEFLKGFSGYVQADAYRRSITESPKVCSSVWRSAV